MLRVHRPKSSHDEDDGDLQRLQEEFLASQVEPSTRVSSSAKKVQQDAAPMEESLLAKVLSSDIIERDPDADYVSAGSFQSPKSVSGFPQVMHRSEFKRRLGTDRKFKRTAIIAPSIPTDDGIHQENMDKITAMGSEEMKASVQELESVLDPSILEMLKKRAAKKYGSTSSDSPSTPAAKQHLNSDKEPSSKNKKFSFSESNSTFQIPSNHDHGSHSHDQEPKEVHLLYFNASGAIVERDEDHSRHLSCADHVAHVDGESYGIPDLLKLTRSVSKELQVKSLTVLHRIVEKALESGYGDQTEKVLQAMYKHEIFLHLRVSLDGKMGSAELGLRILALLVLHVSEESSAWEDIHYTRSRQLAFSFSVDHAQMFKSSALGLYKEEPFEMDGSFESIRKMLKKDIIAGLLVTSITDRFKFFLGLRDLSQETTTHMLEILKVLARHSKQSANKIMETSGLVECLLERLKDPEYGQSLLILFKSLCVVSKGNAEKFAAMGGLERVMRWLTSLNDTPETALSWSLLAVVSNYGLFVPIFSDYRPLIYTKAQSLLKFSNDTETLKSRVGFLKTMTVMATLTVPQTEIGGFDDELKPFVDWALSLFPWKIDWYSLEGGVLVYSLASVSALFDFFRAYVSSTQASPVSKELCRKIRLACDLLYADASRKALELCQIHPCPTETLKGYHGLGMQHVAIIQSAKSSLSQTFGFDFLSSWLDLQTAINKHLGPNTCMDHALDEAIESALMKPVESSWTRGFGQGSTRFLLAVVEHCKNEVHESRETAELLMKAVFGALGGLLPGDEVFVSRLLTEVIFNPHWRSVLGMKEASDDGTLRRMTLDLYDRGLYQDAQLKQSSNLHKFKATELDLFSECPFKGPCLPIRQDWVLGPFDAFLQEEKNGVRIFFDDMKGFILECFSVLHLSDSYGKSQDASVKLSQIMKLFLLSSEDDQHFFNDTEVEQELDSCFKKYSTQLKGPSLDESLGGRGRFYQLYTELLDQYASSSFGNRVFGTYLLLPMTMEYPPDYRCAFWTTLEHSLRSLTLSSSDISETLYRALLEPKETDRQVLRAMAKVQVMAQLDPQRNSLLYALLDSHMDKDQWMHKQ